MEQKTKQFWYHGTAYKNLSPILSQGLIPSPKQRAWEVDSETKFDMASRKSIGGIYVTTNVLTALSSARLGNEGSDKRVIVIASLSPNSVMADEDDVQSKLIQVNPVNLVLSEPVIKWLWADVGKGESSDFVEKAKKDYIAKNIKSIEHSSQQPLHPELIKRLTTMLSDGFYIALARNASHVRVDDLRDDDLPPLPDKIKAETEFRNFVDKYTRVVKFLSDENKKNDYFNITGRVLTPITYSGQNKITSVLIVHSNNEIEVIYGDLPNEFKKDWSSKVGEIKYRS